MKTNGRRDFLRFTAAFAVEAAATAFSARISSAAQIAQLDPGEWMAQAGAFKGSDSPLKMQRFFEPIYILLAPIEWRPNRNQNGYLPVVAPTGFVTDLASIPRVFWSALRPDAEYAYAAIIHDYLYWSQALSKEKSDMIFKMSMEDLEVDRKTVDLIYAAVTRFGRSAWDRNAALKRLGERRVLAKFPPNARTKWSEWKLDNSVFVNTIN